MMLHQIALVLLETITVYRRFDEALILLRR
jgi:hypothetical protein